MHSQQKRTIIGEREIINKNIKTNTLKHIQNKNLYSLTNNMFDPVENSPPNDFMLKLAKRMQIYQTMDNTTN